MLELSVYEINKDVPILTNELGKNRYFFISRLTVTITVYRLINSGSAYEKDRRQREQSFHRISHLSLFSLFFVRSLKHKLNKNSNSFS